ncbi:MAG: hypothetical protein ACXADS_14485 [Candidatus Thorarchaeota archaeon]|jgi:hypothetical protein
MCDHKKCPTNKSSNKTKKAKVKREETAAYKAGVATTEAVAGGLGLLGRGTIWLSRQVANGTKAAGKGIADEYKRQQQHGFSKE